jgi:hypothetical protein
MPQSITILLHALAVVLGLGFSFIGFACILERVIK